MHGGTVEARSEGRGQGSEFVVRLPLVPSSAPGRRRPRRASRAARRRGLAAHPGRGRQPGRRRQPGDDAAVMGNEIRTRLRRAAARGRGRGVPARRGAAGHRPAEDERLRGRAARSRQEPDTRDRDRRAERLRPGGRPPTCRGRGL